MITRYIIVICLMTSINSSLTFPSLSTSNLKTLLGLIWLFANHSRLCEDEKTLDEPNGLPFQLISLKTNLLAFQLICRFVNEWLPGKNNEMVANCDQSMKTWKWGWFDVLNAMRRGTHSKKIFIHFVMHCNVD